MGDRYSWLEQCECGGEIEGYDAPSSLMYSRTCDKCGYKDPLEYFENEDGTIVYLETKEQNDARKTNKRK